MADVVLKAQRLVESLFAILNDVARYESCTHLDQFIYETIAKGAT